jgi:hypothetical protein
MLVVRKIIWENCSNNRRPILVGLLLAALSLAAPSAPATESQPDQSPWYPSLLDGPMLESDFPRPAAAPGMRVALPGLLDSPSLGDPLPEDPQDQNPKRDSALLPASLVVRGPRLQAEEIPMAEDNLDELALKPPPPPPVRVDETIPSPPLTPEFATFDQPMFKPPATVPPDIVTIPFPTLGAEEFAPYSQVQLSRRYALQLRTVLSGVYDDNASISNTNRQSDYILSLAPELAFAMGSDQSEAALRIIYAPVLNWYTQGTNKDGMDQNVQLLSRYKTEKLLLGLNLSAATAVSGGTLDTPQITESQTYVAALSAIYQFDAKISLDVTADNTYLKYSGFNTSDEPRLQGFVNYQLRNFKFGAGTLIGLLDAETQSTQRYIQPLLRVIYAPVGKLTFSAVGGYEFRNLGGESGQRSTPIFQLDAAYELFSQTMVSIDALRHVYSSVSLGGQTYILTSFSGTIRHKFNGYGRNFFLSLTGGIENNQYSQGGENNYSYTRVAFDWALRERCLIGGFYEYSESWSSGGQGANGFNRNRIGLQLTLIYF